MPRSHLDPSVRVREGWRGDERALDFLGIEETGARPPAGSPVGRAQKRRSLWRLMRNPWPRRFLQMTPDRREVHVIEPRRSELP